MPCPNRSFCYRFCHHLNCAAICIHVSQCQVQTLWSVETRYVRVWRDCGDKLAPFLPSPTSLALSCVFQGFYKSGVSAMDRICLEIRRTVSQSPRHHFFCLGECRVSYILEIYQSKFSNYTLYNLDRRSILMLHVCLSIWIRLSRFFLSFFV